MVQTTIFLSPDKRLRQLAALAAVVALDGRHHAGRALEVEERLLQLRVDHVAVGDHQHGVEHLLVLRVVQLGEKVRRPRDGVGLARAGRVLDQILAARALPRSTAAWSLRVTSSWWKRGKMIRVDLLLLVPLGDEVAAEDFQPALPLPDLLPEVGRAMAARRVHRIARRAVVALVEGQEHASPGHPACVTIATSLLLTAKCTSAPLREGEQRLGGLPFGLRVAGRSDTGRSHRRCSG